MPTFIQVTVKPCSWSCISSLHHSHTSHSGRPTLLQVEGRVIVGTMLGLYSGCAKISHLNCSSDACVHIAVHRHAQSCLVWRMDIKFLTFPSSISPSPCTSTIGLWNRLLNTITDCNSQGDFQYLCSSFDYSDCKNITTSYYDPPWHAEYEWPSHEVHASSAWLLCTVSSYFLDAAS
jgi:hypothetical protein